MLRLVPMFVAVLSLASCGDEMVRVQATIPAQRVDLAANGVKKIAIGDIKESEQQAMRGSAAEAVGEELRGDLVALNRFEILDRTVVQDMVKEHALDNSGLVDGSTTTQTGKFSGATALIIGNLMAYHVHSTVQPGQIQTAQGPRMGYRRVTTGVIDASFRLVDLTTGRLVAAVPCHAEASSVEPPDSVSMIPGMAPASHPQYSPTRPDEADTSQLMASLRHQAAMTFVSAISPTQVDYQVALETDSDVPELGEGSKDARIGEWASAAQHFRTATTQAPTKPAGFYDLGIALRATGDFPGALAAFKAAYHLKDDQRYEVEITRTKTFAAGAAEN